MKVFIITFVFAVFQTVLLKFLLESVTKGKRLKAVGLFLLKFVLYGAAIGLFMFKYLSFAVYCFCGFALGMPLTAFVLFIYYSFVKKK